MAILIPFGVITAFTLSRLNFSVNGYLMVWFITACHAASCRWLYAASAACRQVLDHVVDNFDITVAFT